MSFKTIQQFKGLRAATRPVTFSVMRVVNSAGDDKAIPGHTDYTNAQEAKDMARELEAAGMGFYYWRQNP